MRQRRDLLKQTFAFGVGSALGLRTSLAIAAPRKGGDHKAYIGSVHRRDQTILRLGGLGDGYNMTWGAGDRQYVVVNDGPGWADPPTDFYNTRLWTVSNSIEQAAFAEVGGYPDLSRSSRPEDAPIYYGHGLLAVRGRLYQFLSTLDRAEDRPRHWIGAKLIYSDDEGRTWYNQDGSTPVVWEDWNEQSRGRLTFFEESGGCFSLLSILQMGQDYGANRDGYIYVYGLNGSVDGLMNQLMMFRVPIGQMLNRGAYEFFAGSGGTGQARWVGDIAARTPVHTFPRGWVNSTNLFPGDLVVESWLPSVVYNEPLGLYMMASAGIGCAPDGTEFGKPSYLGFWVSSTPWGPWRQVHEDAAWTPAGDEAARAYAPQIAPRWISADGKSLWLIWADLNGIREFGRDEALLTAALEKASGPQQRAAIEMRFLRQYMPSFAFNAQRVDLVLR